MKMKSPKKSKSQRRKSPKKSKSQRRKSPKKSKSQRRKSPKKSKSQRRKSPKKSKSQRKKSPKKSKSQRRKSPKKSKSQRRKSPKKSKSQRRKSPKKSKSQRRKSPKKSKSQRKKFERYKLFFKSLEVDNKKEYIPWYIVTKEGCPYCEDAKKLLTDKNQKYTTKQLSDDNRDEIYEETDVLTMNFQNSDKAYRYFPMIFKVDTKGDKDFIGGYTELKILFL